MKTATLWIHKLIKNKDMYGKQITFTYKGEETLKTFWGGILSLVIMTVLLISFCTNMYTLINRNDSQTYTKTVYKDNFDNSDK